MEKERDDIVPSGHPAMRSAQDSPRMLQCAFRTGAWQCQWGRYAGPTQDSVLCEVHAAGLRLGVSSTREFYEILVDLRADHQSRYPPQNSFTEKQIQEWKRLRYVEGLSEAEALAAMESVPFYWQDLELCWHQLTGLPIPISGVQGLTP